MSTLGEAVLRGEMRAAARVCRLVDEGAAGHTDLLRELFPHTGKGWRIGITGNPGAGKSTVTNELIGEMRSRGHRVAVVAVDPSSPFSGGAILGDRIRMQRHVDDPEVFVRSVATRGALGGLSRSTLDMVRILEAWGATVVFIETVGVGQDEFDVVRAADTTVVVSAPGLGDDVQAIKAGLLECADVFVVNKADRDGADGAVRDLEMMIALGASHHEAGAHSVGHAGHALDVKGAEAHHDDGTWVPVVHKTVATRKEGIAVLVGELLRHQAWLFGTPMGQARRSERLSQSLRTEVVGSCIDALVTRVESDLSHLVTDIVERRLDPYQAKQRLLEIAVARFQSEHR